MSVGMRSAPHVGLIIIIWRRRSDPPVNLTLVKISTDQGKVRRSPYSRVTLFESRLGPENPAQQ